MNSAEIKINYSLKAHNTFKLDVYASAFYEYDTESQIIDFIDKGHLTGKEFLVLGSGSNILFTGNFEGLVIHPKTYGISIVNESKDKIEVCVSAGEIWDDFVQWAVNKNYYGIENLSMIPGTVGASAIQNIGAYGSEVSDLITEVKYIDITDKKIYTINNKDCEFSYRNSIFKTKLKNKVIILSVNFQLQKSGSLNCEYTGIPEALSCFKNPGLKEMRQSIINIRNSKLPAPEDIGNAGSFFKNPVTDNDTYQKLKKDFPDIKAFYENNSKIKIAAAWLIEKCGLKNYEHYGASVYEKQPLIIINKNNATGKAIFEFSEIIRKKVFEKFGLNLEPEVIIL